MRAGVPGTPPQNVAHGIIAGIVTSTVARLAFASHAWWHQRQDRKDAQVDEGGGGEGAESTSQHELEAGDYGFS